jgi:hypothetical protein
VTRQWWKEGPLIPTSSIFAEKPIFNGLHPVQAIYLISGNVQEEGAQIIFQLSIELHGKKAFKAKEVVVDTTVQKKKITYPTEL